MLNTPSSVLVRLMAAYGLFDIVPWVTWAWAFHAQYQRGWAGYAGKLAVCSQSCWLLRIAQHLSSIYVTHFSQFAKNTDSVPQTFVHGGTAEVQTPQRNSAVFVLFVFWLQEHFTLQRQRLHDRCHVHSSLTSGKLWTNTIFSSVTCTPRKVIRHMTFDFDIRKTDLDVQRSFLNAVPWNSEIEYKIKAAF